MLLLGIGEFQGLAWVNGSVGPFAAFYDIKIDLDSMHLNQFIKAFKIRQLR